MVEKIIGSQTDFQKPITVKKLILHKIPIHSFYLHKGAKINYEEISKLTNGKSGLLEIDEE